MVPLTLKGPYSLDQLALPIATASENTSCVVESELN